MKSAVSADTKSSLDRPFWLRYAVALLAIASVTAIRALLAPLLADRAVFILYVLGVLLASWFGGVGPGMLAAAASVLAAAHFFLPPEGSLAISRVSDQTSLIVFVLVSIGVIAIIHAQRKSSRAAVTLSEQQTKMTVALTRSEERTRLIIQNALEASVSMDSSGVITDWNPAAEQLFGWSKEEVVGRRMSSTLVPERYREAHEKGLAKFLETGVAPVINTRLRVEALRKDGSELPIELTVSLIQGEDSASFSGFLRDMTAEAELEEARERLSTTLSSIGDAVIATDVRGSVTFMNPVAERLTGWTSEEASGRPGEEVFQVINEQTRETVPGPYRAVLEQGTVVALANHSLLVRRDGTEVPIEDSAAPIRDSSGATVGVVLVFHDVSERRHRESVQRFLARATETLASSLDYNETLKKVASLAVPQMADWCAVDMLDEHGELQRLAITHIDPEKVRYVIELEKRYPPDKNAPQGSYNIVRTGKSEFMEEIPQELLTAAAIDEEHMRIIDELMLRSYIGVPLIIEKKVVGVMSFVYAESGRNYTEEDLLTAQHLAARSSIAIQNARLYEKQREELEERTRAQKRVAELNTELHSRLSELEKWFELIPIGLAVAEDPDCKSIRLNPALEEMLGTTRLDGKPESPLRFSRGGKQVSADQTPLVKACKSGMEVAAEELEFMREDGRRLVLMVYATPLLGEDEHIRGSLSAYVDVTDRRIREAQQAAVADLGRHALGGIELSDLFARATKVLTKSLDTDFASIVELVGTERAVLRGARNWEPEDIGKVNMSAGAGSQIGYVMATGGPVAYSDLSAQTDFEPEPTIMAKGVRSGICCPIKLESGFWGSIQTHSKTQREFSAEDRSFMEAIANVLGAAIERERNEEAVLKLAAVVQSSDDAIFSKTIEGVVTSWNAAAEAMYGFSEAEAVGSSIEIIVPADKKGELKDIMRRLRKGEHIEHFETVRRRKDGTEINVAVSIAPMRDSAGQVIGASVIARDITERKVIEEMQRHLLDAIEAERNRLTDILMTVPGVVWEAWGEPDAASQRIDFVSDHVEKMLGYRVDEWLAEPNFWLKIVHPEDRETAAAQAAATFLSGKPGTNQFRWIAKDGRTLWVQAYSVAIKDDAGKPVGMRGVTLDISGLKQAEQSLMESEQRFRMLADSAPVLIWMSGTDKLCIYFNKGWLDFTGRSMEQELGNGWAEGVHPDDLDRCLEIYTGSFDARKPFAMEYRLRRYDGVYRWILDTGIPRFGAGAVFEGYIGSCIDITDRIEAEDKMRNLNLELERRVRDRTAELSAANAELEAFSYSVSHDLRAPLRALDGFSRILMEDYAPRLDHEAKDYLERIRQASQRMGQLIEDLLNLAYVTRTEMNKEPVDLTAMLCGMAEELNSRSDGHRVKFRAAPGMTVEADFRLLKAAMENLMQNAWKFTSKRRDARVEAGIADIEGMKTFFIRDNGAGFDQTYVNKLFQPFQRLHNMTEFSGTGIGLATVDRIVQRHGGRIWAEGQVGKGATFYFTL